MKTCIWASAASALLSTPAAAHKVYDRADGPTVGCHEADDVRTVKRAGNIANGGFQGALKNLALVINKLVDEGKCFRISAGQVAITAPEWQQPENVWRGITYMSTASGERFYTPMQTWTFIGNVNELIP
jgi:hypothetical protein